MRTKRIRNPYQPDDDEYYAAIGRSIVQLVDWANDSETILTDLTIQLQAESLGLLRVKGVNGAGAVVAFLTVGRGAAKDMATILETVARGELDWKEDQWPSGVQKALLRTQAR